MYKISVVATLFLSSMWTTVASANLYHAIQNCDVNEVSTSLAAGENPNQLEPYSPPPIFEAVESYQPAPGCTWEKSRAVLRALIKGGANPNLKLSDGRNPLMVLLR